MMNRRLLLAFSFIGIAAACATPDAPAPQAGPDGLIDVPSGRLDELHVLPGKQLAGYRKVILDPVGVQLRSDFIKQQHGNNYRIQPTYPRYKDVEQVTKEATIAVADSLAKAFRAKGFEIVDTPAAGVMRVSAKVTDLFVNAPDIVSPGYTRNVTRDAGEATLSLEARDALDGKVLARMQHHAIARETPRGNIANDPANTLWMETLYQRWADNCVAEL
jgi:hypothetical protein